MPKVEPRPKADFYRILWQRIIPIWFAWQLLWFLAFEYFIDYSRHPITTLVTTKLALESVFYCVIIIKLSQLNKPLTPGKLITHAALIVMLLLTLQPWFVDF